MQLCANFSFFRETLKVRFTFQPVPGVEEVELSLWGGECEITCNGSLNKCELSHQKRIMKNVSVFGVRTDFTLDKYLNS